MATLGQTASQLVRTLRRSIISRHVRGPVHDPGDSVRGRVHHGQLHRAAGLLHDYDFDHAQLRDVPGVPAGRADACARRGVRGSVRVVRRVNIHRCVDTREPAVAVRPRPSRRRGILPEGVAHHAARATDVQGQVAGRGQRRDGAPVENPRPAIQTGRVQTDGDNDGVPVLPAVQRVVRAHRVHDAAAEQPARDSKQLSGNAAGGLRQPRRHGPAVGAVVAFQLQTTVRCIVHGLRRVNGDVGRVPVLGRAW